MMSAVDHVAMVVQAQQCSHKVCVCYGAKGHCRGMVSAVEHAAIAV